MRTSAKTRKIIVGTLLLVFFLAGCVDCQDTSLDGMEMRLRAKPERAGKVGTLRALEVSHVARQVAHRVGLKESGPCEIGWSIDEPFAVEFRYEISVTRGRWTRHWLEEGAFEKDEAGWWEIAGAVEYRDGDQSAGSRSYRVRRDEEGFWEWLGPEQVAFYGISSAAERNWKREFGGRFAELKGVVASGWQEEGEGRWRPGESAESVCAPLGGQVSSAWQPLLMARVRGQRAEIVVHEEDSRRCRTLMSSFQLEGGGQLEATLRECHRGGDEALDERPRVEEVVDVERHRERSQVHRRLQQWMEAGIVEPGEN